MRSGIWGDRSSIWGDRSSIGADQCKYLIIFIQIWDRGFGGTDQAFGGTDHCKSLIIFIQISLTPGQVATDVCQALEYSTWKAHVHINQRIPTPVSKELLSEDILRMAHTVHSVPLSIFRAQGPPDSLLSSCDPPFWCHGFLCHGDIQIQFCNICRNHISFSVPFNHLDPNCIEHFQFELINCIYLIIIRYKKKVQINWTTYIIKVPVTPCHTHEKIQEAMNETRCLRGSSDNRQWCTCHRSEVSLIHLFQRATW